MTRLYVLDANAVLSLIDDASGAERVQQLLTAALHHDQRLLISAVNWGEVFYVSWERRGEEAARRTMASFSRLPVEVVPADTELIAKAAEIKAVHKIPYADSIAAALAELRGATLVTSDRDFEKLGRRIQVLWLARS